MVRQKTRPLEDPRRFRSPAEPRRSERRERRSPLCILLKICGFSAAGRIFSELAGTRNISRSGCCVRLRTQPLADTALAVQVIPREDPLPESGAQMLYQMAWLRKRGDSWDVGLFALGDTDLLRVAFAELTT